MSNEDWQYTLSSGLASLRQSIASTVQLLHPKVHVRTSGVARTQAMGALAWGVQIKYLVNCSNFLLFDIV
jgi:hypothetical protein